MLLPKETEVGLLNLRHGTKNKINIILAQQLKQLRTQEQIVENTHYKETNTYREKIKFKQKIISSISFTFKLRTACL